MFFCFVLSDKRVIRPARGREKNNIVHIARRETVSLTFLVGRYLSVTTKFGACLSVRIVEKFRNIRSKFAWVGDVTQSYCVKAVNGKPSVFSSFHDQFLWYIAVILWSGPWCQALAANAVRQMEVHSPAFAIFRVIVRHPTTTIITHSLINRMHIHPYRYRRLPTALWPHWTSARMIFVFLFSRLFGCSWFCPVGYSLFFLSAGHVPLSSSRYSGRSLSLVRRSVFTAGIIRYHTPKPDPSSVRELAGFHHHRLVAIFATENRVSAVVSSTSVRRVSSSAPRFLGYAVCAVAFVDCRQSVFLVFFFFF